MPCLSECYKSRPPGYMLTKTGSYIQISIYTIIKIAISKVMIVTLRSISYQHHWLFCFKQTLEELDLRLSEKSNVLYRYTQQQ